MERRTRRLGANPDAASETSSPLGGSTRAGRGVGLRKSRLGLRAENFGESTTACLLAMVQGNVLTLTASHWLIASRTGLMAGLAATMVLVAIQRLNKWVVAGTLAAVTAVVDYFSHPATFGEFVTEAVLTGLAAGALSLLVASVYRRWKARSGGESRPSPGSP